MKKIEFSNYPLRLTEKRIENLYGAIALTTQEKKTWGLWRLSEVNCCIFIKEKLKVQTIGRPAWEIENNKATKNQELKKLQTQRKILIKYIKDNK